MKLFLILLLGVSSASASGRVAKVGRLAAPIPTLAPSSLGLKLEAPALGTLPTLAIPQLPTETLPKIASPQLAIGTPGVYTKAFHAKRTNPVIKEAIDEKRFIRLDVGKDGKLDVAQQGEALPPKTIERVVKKAQRLGDALKEFSGASLMLIEGNAAHPHVLAVSKQDYQLAHAGTNKGKGKFAYMTTDLFANEVLSDDALLGAVEEEFEHAVERFEGGTSTEKYGKRQRTVLEKVLATVKLDFATGRKADEEPKRSLWEKLAGFFAPKENRIPWSYKPVNKVFLYHGSSFADFMAIVDSGGDMKPEVSQFSSRSRDSIGYGNRRSSERKSPMLLLQFPEGDLRPLTSGKMFQPAIAASLSTGSYPEHAAYVAAEKPVALSLMTEPSKQSIVDWMRDQRVRYPEDTSWDGKIARVKAILWPNA